MGDDCASGRGRWACGRRDRVSAAFSVCGRRLTQGSRSGSAAVGATITMGDTSRKSREVLSRTLGCVDTASVRESELMVYCSAKMYYVGDGTAIRWNLGETRWEVSMKVAGNRCGTHAGHLAGVLRLCGARHVRVEPPSQTGHAAARAPVLRPSRGRGSASDAREGGYSVRTSRCWDGASLASRLRIGRRRQ